MQSEEKSLLKNKIKTIFKDRIFVSLVIGGFFLNIISFLILKIFINFDQTTFILHYNVFFGIDGISFNFNENPLELFLAPIGSSIIWLINLILAFFLYLTFLSEQLQYVEAKNEIDKGKKSDEDSSKDFYPKIFGGYLLLANSLVITLIIGVYILSIILVNN